MIGVIWKLVSTFGGRFMPALPSLSGFFGAIGAALAAIPETLKAIGGILKTIGESPVLSLLLGAAMGSLVAGLWVHSLDAPIRERHRAAAIQAANERADVAIRAAKADFERQIAALKKTNSQPRKQAR